jgi:hypothetical protein
VSFISEILTYESVSVVGLAKNAGKTVCLNYVLKALSTSKKQIAVTSIGIDGESADQVTGTEKPEITIYEGMMFVTSEAHYREKRLIAQVMNVSEQQTALGRWITAKALSRGKVLLSGPSDTHSLKQLIDDLKQRHVDLTLVDGAVSRLSLGSPAVTDALILATGAAVSGNIPQLVQRTKYVYDRIRLEQIDDKTAQMLAGKDDGIWSIAADGTLYRLNIPSVLLFEQYRDELFRYGTTLIVFGVVSDKLLRFLKVQKMAKDIVLIVYDFTKIFASAESYYAFLKRGGRIRVIRKSKLIAVSINPQSPDGYRLDSEKLQRALEESLKIPVYDVRKTNETK